MIRTTRRALGALSASVASAVLALPLLAQPPRAVPLSETVHGITLQDEYRWMEDPANRTEMLAFVEAENARTRAMLDALPERAWFAKRLEESSSSLSRIGGYTQCGDKALLLRAGASDRVPKLYLREPAGERLFLDPARVGANPLASFGTYSWAPDCRRVSVQVSNAGAEAGRTHLFDVATGVQIGAPVERIWGEFPVAFVGKDQILYTQMAETPVDGDPLKAMTAYIAPLSGGTPTRVLGNGLVVQPNNFPFLSVESEKFALGFASGARADNDIYISPTDALLAGKPQWRQVAKLADKVSTAVVRGEALYLLTTRTNGAGMVMRHPLGADGAPGPGKAVFEGTPERLIKTIASTRDGIYIRATSDGAARLFYLPDGRGPAQEIALPFEGSIVAMEPDADRGGLSFGITGWAQGTTAMHVRGAKLTNTGLSSQVWDGAPQMEALRMEATSKDGTRVPMVVLRRKGATGRTPTIVQGYGGYGIDTVFPGYGRNTMAWLDRGGAYAYCGTRGGGERGRAWHEGGRATNKPRAMEDLAACARHLTAAGIAPERGPLATGGSMGGTLVPTAALTDPGAFGAMITSVGVVNPSRIAAAENGANQFDEVGNPANPAQFRDLVAMDAYQMIPGAKTLPPTMMVIGLNDKRVSPWMTAKWVARARAKWPDAPIYMRGDAQAGHGVGSAEDVRRAETADIYAFAWSQQSR